jgi:hypothetical protein
VSRLVGNCGFASHDKSFGLDHVMVKLLPSTAKVKSQNKLFEYLGPDQDQEPDQEHQSLTDRTKLDQMVHFWRPPLRTSRR